MSSVIALPRSVLLKLRCKLCMGYLSVPPISGYNGRYTCGRCDPLGYGNELYEELARFVLFPCIYKNCAETLNWENVRTHEEKCGFRPVRCPFYLCHSEIERGEIDTHFISTHADSFARSFVHQSPAIRLKDVTSLEHCVYMCYGELNCLIFARMINEFQGHNLRYTLEFGVFSLNTCNGKSKLKYDVTVSLTSTVLVQSLCRNGEDILAFEDSRHCFDCLKNECSIIHHKHDDKFLTNKFLDLCSQNNQHVTYKIKIYVADSPTPDRNLGLAAKLECPICNNYMFAPIFNCPNGHSVCNVCRSQLEVCPFCKAKMGKSRNYTLEDIAETLEVPCQNVSEGCNFIGLVNDVLKHGKSCNS